MHTQMHLRITETTIYFQEMNSIDNVMKTKLQNYNLAKGSLTQMQRKKTSVPHSLSVCSERFMIVYTVVGTFRYAR